MEPYILACYYIGIHGGVLISQCEVRPTVTFPVLGHRCPTTDGTELYDLVSEEARVCVNNFPKVTFPLPSSVTAGSRTRDLTSPLHHRVATMILYKR